MKISINYFVVQGFKFQAQGFGFFDFILTPSIFNSQIVTPKSPKGDFLAQPSSTARSPLGDRGKKGVIKSTDSNTPYKYLIGYLLFYFCYHIFHIC